MTRVNEETPSAPEPGLDVAMLAAALRADRADVDTYAHLLTITLSDTLPDGMVEVERTRSLADRVAGRPGSAKLLRVRAGDVTLELAPGRDGHPVARQVKEVRGVVISRSDITLPQWTQLLAEKLATMAHESERANGALAALLGL